MAGIQEGWGSRDRGQPPGSLHLLLLFSPYLRLFTGPEFVVENLLTGPGEKIWRGRAENAPGKITGEAALFVYFTESVIKQHKVQE